MKLCIKDLPLVSIIVPIYNVEQYLPQCLDSLINQTYPNIEIICVNDGSPDNSAKILVDYQNKDSRIKIINQKNTGLSGARNKGIKNATGYYMMFVDSDDWIDLNTCEEAVKAAENNNADLIMWSYVREFTNKSNEKLMFWDDEQVFKESDVKVQINRRLCGLYKDELAHPDYANAIETAWGKLYRRSIIAKNNVEFVSEKEIGTEDALFNLYATNHVKKAVYLKKCFNHYRRDNIFSLTSNYNEKLYQQWQRLFDYMNDYIVENHFDKSFRVALNNRIALSIVGLGLNIIGSNYQGKKKRIMMKEIVSSTRYRNACKTLDFCYFPIHWKVLFFCAKHQFIFPLYFLLMVIHKIINK